MEHCCSDMREMVEEENSIIFIPEFREYGVPICDGGSSFLQMQFCPWCGIKLPGSLREEYFSILDGMGINYPCPPEEVPENMRSEKWWQEKKADNLTEAGQRASTCRTETHRETDTGKESEN